MTYFITEISIFDRTVEVYRVAIDYRPENKKYKEYKNVSWASLNRLLSAINKSELTTTHIGFHKSYFVLEASY